jgi:hypothetical protein
MVMKSYILKNDIEPANNKLITRPNTEELWRVVTHESKTIMFVQEVSTVYQELDEMCLTIVDGLRSK